jgi:transcriptional regulator with XRE-family HTH domain
MDERKDLGAAVAFLRYLRGWDERDLARASGIEESLIPLYEQGFEAPTRRALERMTAAVGVSFKVFEEHVAFARQARAMLRYGLRELELADEDAVIDEIINGTSREIAIIIAPEVVRPPGKDPMALRFFERLDGTPESIE